jgi:zinc D-Ala-D-Ala carboxypeptidase
VSRETYRERVLAILASLGISPEALSPRPLVLCEEATDLVVAETGQGGREHLLVPEAARAWQAMKAAAAADGMDIRIVSAFRSVGRQADIVRAKLTKGLSLEEILQVSAPPGYSEHHSGRAVDLTTPGVRPLEEEFDSTAAFGWLTQNAARFGFNLSYPANNSAGYLYEPWHWCHRSRHFDDPAEPTVTASTGCA